jgi:hypothetical protein
MTSTSSLQPSAADEFHLQTSPAGECNERENAREINDAK